MALTNAEKQAAFRERLRSQGKTQILLTVDAGRNPVAELRSLWDDISAIPEEEGATAAILARIRARLGDALSAIW